MMKSCCRLLKVTEISLELLGQLLPFFDMNSFYTYIHSRKAIKSLIPVNRLKSIELRRRKKYNFPFLQGLIWFKVDTQVKTPVVLSRVSLVTFQGTSKSNPIKGKS
eukprot:UN00881